MNAFSCYLFPPVRSSVLTEGDQLFGLIAIAINIIIYSQLFVYLYKFVVFLVEILRVQVKSVYK